MSALRSRLPPSNSLVVFETAARLGSFARTAEALNVTPGAVTQQISRLEEFVGVRLFQPQGRGRVLTSSGQLLYEAVTIGLEHIAGAITRIRQQEGPLTLTIATPLAFASHWLVPRISGFRQAHPDIALRFITADADLDPATEGLGLAVRYGSGDWPHLHVTPLLQPHVFPVCSPGYLAGSGGISAVADLLKQTLLDRDPEVAGSFGIGWATWLRHVDKTLSPPRHRMYFSSYEVVIRSCLAGQGLALGVDVLVADLIREGLLVAPVGTSVTWKEAYYLVAPKSEPITRPIRLFSEWLLGQAAEPLAGVPPLPMPRA